MDIQLSARPFWRRLARPRHYPLGARFHIPHGHANALVMAQMIRFNLPAAQRQYGELAAHLLPGDGVAAPDRQ